MECGSGKASGDKRWLQVVLHAELIAKGLLNRKDPGEHSLTATREPVAKDEADAYTAEDTHCRQTYRKGTVSDLRNGSVAGEKGEQ
jgi:hypothetical protein